MIQGFERCIRNPEDVKFPFDMNFIDGMLDATGTPAKEFITLCVCISGDSRR